MSSGALPFCLSSCSRPRTDRGILARIIPPHSPANNAQSEKGRPAGSEGCAPRLRQRHRYLVEPDRVLERELVEHRFPERRFDRGMAQRLRVRPRAVEPGKIAGPQEIIETDLGYPPEPRL